jgi:Autophagy-related protein 101
MLGHGRLTLRLTIVFTASIRSPGPVTPREVECEGFDVTYTRIATNHKPAQRASSSSAPSYLLENDVDRKVDDAIESFLRSLSQIGPELLSVS